MARITVEDCLEKVDNQYDLVLLAKERTVQLNAGAPMLVEEDNDKRTIISLREIGDGKIDVKEVEASAIKRLRKEPDELEEDYLDKAWGLEADSRLSCQAQVAERELVVEIPKYTLNMVSEHH